MRHLLAFLLVFAPHVAFAETLTMATWNLEGPGGLETKQLKEFATLIGDTDVVVLEETLGVQQTTDALQAAGLPKWQAAVSDFAKDTLEPYQKLEVAVLTPHAIGNVREIDPYPADDTPEMQAKDENFEVPSLIPEKQRKNKGGRGWLWVEIPTLKLVVIAVHLKSSQGAVGFKDQDNSFKREAVAAGIGVAILADSKARSGWSYVVAGDFNVSPGDAAKVGTDLNKVCTADDCTGYDQTHALFSSGMNGGLAMRNLTAGLSNSYVSGNFAKSPIDNVYALGPIFDRTTKLTLERGDHFGSDHYAIKVKVESKN